MMPILLILALSGLMQAAGSFVILRDRVDAIEALASLGTAQSFGYLMLAAFFAGLLAKRVRLPKLTGYLLLGVLAGPEVWKLIPRGALDKLQLVSGIATALIALTAGTELDLKQFRPLMRTILWLTLIAVMGTTGLLWIAVFLSRPLLPFMQGLPLGQTLAIASVLAVVMVAQSPAVVVALRDEMAAGGPMTRTVLGVVVIADLVVIALFAVASTIAKAAFGNSAGVSGTVRQLAWELLGSIVAGLLIGGVLTLYLKKIRGSAALFILLICCIIAEVGRRLHFDPLLVALAAGMSIRNLTTVGDQLHQAIEASSLPVYVVFFGVAGASIHLDVLTRVGVPALIFVATRATGFLVLGRLGAAAAGAPDAVRRYAGFGLLPQAGLALALSLLFARTFPEFGAEAGALTLGVVALNELLAPALYRAAIVRSGEAGQGAPEFLPLPETEDSDPGTPSPFLTPLAPVATPSEPPPAPGSSSPHGR
ncbi:MAG: cation:proton antiporter [Polyangia bacterium]